MSKFKGYAQQSGLKPIKVDNPADDIKWQTERQVAARRNNINWNRKEATRIARALDYNNDIEAKNRKLNFEAKTEYAKVLQDAKWARYQEQVNRDRAYDQQQINSIQKLLTLTSTGKKLWDQYNAKRKLDATNFAKSLYNEHGIDRKKFEGVRAIDSAIWNISSEREGALHRLGIEQGYQLDVLERIRDASGYERIAFLEQSALRQARLLDDVIGKSVGTEFDMGTSSNPQPMSFDTAPAEMRELVLNRILQEHKQKQGDNWFSSNIWHVSGAATLEEQIKANYLKTSADKDRQEAWENAPQRMANTVKHQIERFNPDVNGRSGVQGVYNAALYYAGQTDKVDAPGWRIKQSMNDVADSIVWGLDKGFFDSKQFKGLYDLPVQQPGAPKGKTEKFGKVFPIAIQKIEKAQHRAHNHEENTFNLAIQQDKLEEKRFIQQFDKAVLGVDTPVEQLHTSLKIAQDNNWKTAEARIVKRLSTHRKTDNDVAGLADITRRVTVDYEHLIPDDVYDYQMGVDATKQGLKLVEKFDRFQPGESHTKTLSDQVDELLGKHIPKKGSESFEPAKIIAMRRAKGIYVGFRGANIPPSEALDKTIDKLALTMKDPDGDFGPVNVNGERIHRIIQERRLEKDNVVIPQPQELANNLKNPTYLYNNPIADYKTTSEYINAINSGRSIPAPESYEMARSIGGIPPIKTLIAQRVYYNQQADMKKGGLKLPEIDQEYVARALELESTVNRKLAWLNTCTDYSSINKASCTSGGRQHYIKPQIDRARTIVQKSTAGDYNNVGTLSSPVMSSTSYLGFTLEDLTVGQVLQLMEDEKYALVTVGANGLQYDDIVSAVDIGNVHKSTKFNKSTQDGLFEIIMKTGGYTIPQGMAPHDNQVMVDINEHLNADTPKWRWPGWIREDLINNPHIRRLLKLDSEELNYAGAN